MVYACFMKLTATKHVLQQYISSYPVFSPATLFDALVAISEPDIDLFHLSELLSAILEDLERSK